MSGTDRGTAYHKVMELLDLAGVLPREEKMEQEAASGAGAAQKQLDAQLQALCESGRLKQAERDAVADRKIEAFLNTDLARRMARAQQAGVLYREQPFVLGLPANKLGEDLPEEETVLIQGIIDVFFEEEDYIVVADYKTCLLYTSRCV